MANNRIYLLVGPHASGKTTLIKRLMKIGIHYIPTYTTRERATIHGNPELYNSVGKESFPSLSLIAKSTYKGDYFGLLKKDVLDSLQQYPVSVAIADTSALKQLTKLLKTSVESIYIMVDYVTLIERMLRMNHSNDEMKYNLEYAENNGEFETYKVATHVVKNVISEEKATDQILAIMGLMVQVKSGLMAMIKKGAQ